MKSIKYIVLVIFALIWLAGINPTFSGLAAKLGLTHDGYQYGDLYKLSNLSAFRDPRRECHIHKPIVNYSSGKPVHLYIIGDSFTEKERIKQGDFDVASYHYTKWSEMLHFKPDTAAINILLVECVERHFREKFAKGSLKTYLKGDTASFNETGKSSVMQNLDNAFKADHSEVRLDQILFQNDFILGLRQMKADFNYHIFGRTNKEVTLVNDGKDIVYYMDTDSDTSKTTSSFSILADTEVDSIVNNVNLSAEFARSLGFDQIILSIIPNKVSVIAPTYGPYNKLIDRVNLHPNLRVPYIEVLSDFQKMGRNSYLKGDSHWTCAGQNVWLDKANQKIKLLISQL